MLEPQEDCSDLITDLGYVFGVLGLAANYQNLRGEFARNVHACKDALYELKAEHGGLWQPELRDTLLAGLSSALDLNNRLQLRHIMRAMKKVS
jgi:hypothetical protein